MRPAMRLSVASLLLSLALAAAAPAAANEALPERLPSIALRYKAGGPADLAHWSDRPTVLNVWATWCPPCRKEMPALQSLGEKLAPYGIQVVVLSVDQDVNLVREFLHKYAISLRAPVAESPSDVYRALDAIALPVTYYVREGGKIVGRHIGARQWDDADALEDILKHLAPAANSAPRANAEQITLPGSH